MNEYLLVCRKEVKGYNSKDSGLGMEAQCTIVWSKDCYGSDLQSVTLRSIPLMSRAVLIYVQILRSPVMPLKASES